MLLDVDCSNTSAKLFISLYVDFSLDLLNAENLALERTNKNLVKMDYL